MTIAEKPKQVNATSNTSNPSISQARSNSTANKTEANENKVNSTLESNVWVQPQPAKKQH